MSLMLSSLIKEAYGVIRLGGSEASAFGEIRWVGFGEGSPPALSLSHKRGGG